jgi:hypothetical protein
MDLGAIGQNQYLLDHPNIQIRFGRAASLQKKTRHWRVFFLRSRRAMRGSLRSYLMRWRAFRYASASPPRRYYPSRKMRLRFASIGTQIKTYVFPLPLSNFFSILVCQHLFRHLKAHPKNDSIFLNNLRRYICSKTYMLHTTLVFQH